MAATGSGVLESEKRDFDAFFRTEVELSKAKRLYQQLEARLDQERALAQDRQGSLHERILALEAQLHKEKIDCLAQEEEATARRKQLEAELKRQKAKYEGRAAVLKEDLHATKEAWVARLTEERKGWQGKLAEKVTLLQGEIDAGREAHAARVAGLEAELAAVGEAKRRVDEELGVARELLQEEGCKRRTLQAELGDLKGKYQRCMELATELLALKGKTKPLSSSPAPLATISTTSTTTTTARPSSSALRSTSTSRLSVGGSARQHTAPAPSEGEILRKQLQLTQALLDEELRKNHNLRRDLARLSASASASASSGVTY